MSGRVFGAAALAILGAAGCTFDPSGSGDVAQTSDATPGGPDGSTACTPGERVCSGRNLETCDADGTGFVADLTVGCPLGCEDDHCTAASNVPEADQLACGDGAPALAPPVGGSVTVRPDASIGCSPDCGGGVTEIPSSGSFGQGGGATLTWFCLSALELPAGVAIAVDRQLDAVAFVVAGDASIDGAIGLPGLDAGVGGVGAGAAGGFDGGVGDAPGGGPCGGAAGGVVFDFGVFGDQYGGGGGGAGHGGVGGSGGVGREPDTSPAAGGAGGAACGVPTLEPLIGGSGGGGGGGTDVQGNGGPGGDFEGAWAGGGGGGAVQLSVRRTLRIGAGGRIDVGGGAGVGYTNDPEGFAGGGGGGAGGAILLEAASLVIEGLLDVSGGDGGAARAGIGGPGASALASDGAAGTGADQGRAGGAGGGGAGGRVRLNGASGATCTAAVVPSASCTAGALHAASP